MFKHSVRLCAALIAVASFCTSCGEDEEKKEGAEASDSVNKGENQIPDTGTGCLQGLVVNAHTSALVEPVPDDEAAGVFVRFGNKDYRAKSYLEKQDKTRGDWVICGLPVEVPLEVRASIDGYENFVGYVRIPSTLAARSGSAERDLLLERPVLFQNIRLFPKGGRQDMLLKVFGGGAPVSGASIRLHLSDPDTSAFSAHNDEFMTPFVATTPPQLIDTDAGGTATLSKELMSPGARYEFLVTTADASFQTTTGAFTYGVAGEGDAAPYELLIDLTPSDQPLTVVSQSILDDAQGDSSVSYVFNRPIELAPGSLRTMSASLRYARAAELIDNDPTDDDAEQVSVTIEGSRLTMSALYKKAPDASVEPALQVAFSGISVKPSGGKGQSDSLTLAPTIRVFGGVPPVASSIAVVSGSGQYGAPNGTLADDLVAVVRDQYGQALAGEVVTFSNASATTTAITGANGEASVSWTLGGSSVLQTVTAETETDLTASFLLTAVEVTFDTTSRPQSAITGQWIATPLAFTVEDARLGAPLSGVNVTVEPSDPTTQTGSVVRAAGTTTDGTATLSLVTASDGTFSTEWKMGTVLTAHTLLVTIGSYAQEQLSSRPVALYQPTSVSLSSVGSASNTAASTNDYRATVSGSRLTSTSSTPTTGWDVAGVTVLITATAPSDATVNLVGQTPAATATGATDSAGDVDFEWTLGAAAATDNTITATLPDHSTVAAATATLTTP